MQSTKFKSTTNIQKKSSVIQIDKVDWKRKIWFSISISVNDNLFRHIKTGFIGALKIIEKKDVLELDQ